MLLFEGIVSLGLYSEI